MLRSALTIALIALTTACGGEDPADLPPDPCPPQPAEDVQLVVGLRAFALHEAPEWTMEAEYRPTACYGSLDCSPWDDLFYFVAPEAARYRFTTDYGDLYFGGACGHDAFLGREASFAYDGRQEFVIELEAGEAITGRSFLWTDIDFEDPPATYFVRVERVDPVDSAEE